MDDESPVSTSWSPGNLQNDRDDPSLARPSSSSSSAQAKDYGELPCHSQGPDSGHDMHMPSGSRLSSRNQHHHHEDDDGEESDAGHFTRRCSPHSQQQPPTSTTSSSAFQASRRDAFGRAGSHQPESYGQSYGEASPSSHHQQQHHHRSYQSMQEDHVGSSQGSLPRLLTTNSVRIENDDDDEDDEDDHVSSRFVLNEVSNLNVEAMLADAPVAGSVDDGYEGRSQTMALSLGHHHHHHHHHHSMLETDPTDGDAVTNVITGNVVTEAGGSGLQSEDVLVISGRRTNASWEQAVARVHDHDAGVHFGRMTVATQSTTATTSKTSSSSSMIVSSMQNYVTSSTGCLVESGSSGLSQHSAGLTLDSVVDSTVSARSVVDDEVVGMDGSLVGIVRYTTTDDVSTTVDGSGHLSISSADVEGLNSAMDASSVSIGESSSMEVLRADFSLADGVNATLSSTLESHQDQHLDISESIDLNEPSRNMARQRSLDQTVKGVWCEECNILYESGCLKHRIQTIFDKPVLSRAWASLPGSHLSIEKVGDNPDGSEVLGVFTKKVIPRRTQFGPVEGVLTKKIEGPLMHLVLQLECVSGEMIFFDTSDESQSNWMRFVRPATNYSEQNVVVVQHGTSLYYTTVRTIPAKTELKVGYSQPYAERRGLEVLESEDGSKYDDDEGWPCFACSKKFCSSVELQKHLNEHGDGLTVCKVDDVEVHDFSEAIGSSHVQEVDGEEANIAEIHDIDVTSEASTSGRRRNRVRVAPIKKSLSSKLKSIKKRTSETVDEDGGVQSGHGEFPCNLCNKVFPRPYSLQRHLTMHSGEKKFKCPICEMRFTHVYNRNRHVRRHKARGDTCMSDSQGRPKSLFRKKHAVNEWICTHCDLTFDNANLLNLHTLTHAAEDVGGLDELGKHEPNCGGGLLKEESSDEAECLRCPQCTQEFQTKKELINHTSIHGKMRKSFRGLVNPNRPYKCELCYKAFATEERLHRHMLVHGSDDSKPLQCDVCYKRFLNNSALACHIKVHSEEKKYYECPICKEGFDQIIPLKDHIHVHCLDGLYTCPSCQKSFEEYNQIRKHIRAFHSEKKYPCGQCDKIFPRPDKLKLHMLRHSDHREFLCANCGKQFKRKDKLKEHMKRMHSAEREARLAMRPRKGSSSKKFIPKVSPTDYHRFIYKCHTCLLGFKRRGMLVNHLAKRHPGIRPESVPELNLPILKTTRDYYCQYCEKIYKSSSKRKAHILKQHPGAELPMSNRRKGGIPEIPGMPNPTFSQTVGSITTHPHNCDWCHKQYASKAKLLQHQRKKHQDLLPQVSLSQQLPRVSRDGSNQFASTTRTQANAVILREVVSEVEYVTEGVVLGSNIKPTLTKDGVVVTTTRPTTVFLERDSSSPNVGESHVTVEAIPTADLLTQAMSELTQNLSDYRSQGTSSSATSVPPSDQSALSQLLGTYVATSSSSNSEATESGPLDSPTSSPAQSSTTTVYVPRTWAGTFEYSTR